MRQSSTPFRQGQEGMAPRDEAPNEQGGLDQLVATDATPSARTKPGRGRGKSRGRGGGATQRSLMLQSSAPVEETPKEHMVESEDETAGTFPSKDEGIASETELGGNSGRLGGFGFGGGLA